VELKQQLVIPRAIEVVWQALNDPDKPLISACPQSMR
jgi:carbon monoxide dehydrogenase subunit G